MALCMSWPRSAASLSASRPRWMSALASRSRNMGRPGLGRSRSLVVVSAALLAATGVMLLVMTALILSVRDAVGGIRLAGRHWRRQAAAAVRPCQAARAWLAGWMDAAR